MAEWPGVATGSADERPLRRPVARPERAVLGGRADHRVAPPVPRPALPRRHRRHPPAVTAWPRHCERPSRGAAAGTDPPGRHLPRPFLGQRTAGGTGAPTAPGRTRGGPDETPTYGRARSEGGWTGVRLRGGPTAPTPVTTTTSRTAGPCPSHPARRAPHLRVGPPYRLVRPTPRRRAGAGGGRPPGTATSPPPSGTTAAARSRTPASGIGGTRADAGLPRGPVRLRLDARAGRLTASTRHAGATGRRYERHPGDGYGERPTRDHNGRTATTASPTPPNRGRPRKPTSGTARMDTRTGRPTRTSTPGAALPRGEGVEAAPAPNGGRRRRPEPEMPEQPRRDDDRRRPDTEPQRQQPREAAARAESYPDRRPREEARPDAYREDGYREPPRPTGHARTGTASLGRSPANRRTAACPGRRRVRCVGRTAPASRATAPSRAAPREPHRAPDPHRAPAPHRSPDPYRGADPGVPSRPAARPERPPVPPSRPDERPEATPSRYDERPARPAATAPPGSRTRVAATPVFPDRPVSPAPVSPATPDRDRPVSAAPVSPATPHRDRPVSAGPVSPAADVPVWVHPPHACGWSTCPPDRWTHPVSDERADVPPSRERRTPAKPTPAAGPHPTPPPRYPGPGGHAPPDGPTARRGPGPPPGRRTRWTPAAPTDRRRAPDPRPTPPPKRPRRSAALARPAGSRASRTPRTARTAPQRPDSPSGRSRRRTRARRSRRRPPGRAGTAGHPADPDRTDPATPSPSASPATPTPGHRRPLPPPASSWRRDPALPLAPGTPRRYVPPPPSEGPVAPVRHRTRSRPPAAGRMVQPRSAGRAREQGEPAAGHRRPGRSTMRRRRATETSPRLGTRQTGTR